MTARDRPLNIWCIFDGKPGHDTQTRGLAMALSRLAGSRIFELQAPSFTRLLRSVFTSTYSPAEELPDPDLIIGAGHGTHVPMLCARRARGGACVVLMKPSLPISWFDLCLIPAHDQPPDRPGIFRTLGSLTTIQPSMAKDPGYGLLLIGGPSRHFAWDQDGIIRQIKNIASSTPVQWLLTDSPRTPLSASRTFAELDLENLTYIPYTQSSRQWLEEQLGLASIVWVTQDSMTMISEAMASAAAVGLLSMPVKKRGKLSTAANELIDAGRLTSYQAWENGATLSPPKKSINETARAASCLLEYINRQHKQF